MLDTDPVAEIVSLSKRCLSLPLVTQIRELWSRGDRSAALFDGKVSERFKVFVEWDDELPWVNGIEFRIDRRRKGLFSRGRRAVVTNDLKYGRTPQVSVIGGPMLELPPQEELTLEEALSLLEQGGSRDREVDAIIKVSHERNDLTLRILQEAIQRPEREVRYAAFGCLSWQDRSDNEVRSLLALAKSDDDKLVREFGFWWEAEGQRYSD